MTTNEHARRLLVERLLSQRGLSTPPPAVIPARPRTAWASLGVAGEATPAHPFPASHAQELMWLNEQLAIGPFYNLPFEFRLVGPLDVARLERSIGALIERHEPLRTVFRMGDEGLTQWVLRRQRFDLEVEDLTGVPAEDRENAAGRAASAFNDRLFDLANGPLVRAKVFRLGVEEHLFLVVAHHAIADGTGGRVLCRDLAHVYQAFEKGESSELPPLPIQYADYAASERESLTESRIVQHLAYFLDALGDAPRRVELPFDGDPAATLHANDVVVTIPSALVTALAARAADAGGTLFVALRLALDLVLHAWSGQRDIVVGTAHAGRGTAEAEELLGNFVNFVAIRHVLDPDASLADALRTTREATWAALAHHECPFDRVVAALRSERGKGLYNVALLLQNHARAEIAWSSSLRAEYSRLARRDATAVDLRVVVEAPQGGDAVVTFELDPRSFSRTAIERLARHFHRALEAIAASPACRAGDVLLLDDAERRVLEDLARVEESFAAARLERRFEAQAQRAADRVAVTFGGRSLGYRELDERANAVAHDLVRAGVGEEDLVGLVAPPSLETVIGILGILKAGAAYVPLDLRWPAERRELIAADAGLRVIVAPEGAEAGAPGGRRTVLRIGAATAPSPPPRRSRTPDGSAYVIYTSGSTGRPKGVVITHANVSRLFSAISRRTTIVEDDVFSVAHSFAFDFSVWELWGALLHGGRAVVVPGAVAASPDELRALLRAERVTVLSQTPLAFKQLAAHDVPSPDALDALRLVVFGGEALDLTSLRDWFAKYGDVRPALVNMYGITETTVHVTFRALSTADASSTRSFIGRALPDLALRVLDRDLRPVPVGVPGELFVGGTGLARGYLGRAELTAERFVPDPKGAVGARLYRTGDVVRTTLTGDVEYVGRADFQVKIRGHRIELGEVEAAIARYPGVGDVVVVAETAPGGERRIVAYHAPRAGASVDVAGLARSVAAVLPPYMVPAAYVPLEALPMTVNGKVDRRSLPPPEIVGHAAESAPPSSLTDPSIELLIAIWTDVLGARNVGPNDDFFSLGGHSLSAIRTAQRVGAAFGIELPLRAVFEAPTPAALSAWVRREKATAPAVAPLPVLRDEAGRHEPFDLTDIQQAYLVGRTDVFDVGSVACHAYFEVDAVGLDLARFEGAVRRLVARHDMLRVIVTPDGRQRVLEDATPYTVVVEDLEAMPGDARGERLLAIRESLAHQMLPLATGPLFEIRAARLGEGRVRLFYSVDLLLGDAYSFFLAGRELDALYRDPSAVLPPLSLTFRDYVRAERELRKGQGYASAARYWGDRLDTLPGPPELPLATAPSAIVAPRFTRQDHRLPGAAWDRLKRAAGRAGTTPSAVLLTLYASVLARYSKTRNFAIALTVFNRLPLHPDVDRIVGDFTSVTLLETHTTSALTFGENVRALQRQLLDDLHHRQFSGVAVLRELGRRRGAVAAAYPVNFTSTLGMATADTEDAPVDGPVFEPVFALTQTPQLWLDHQVGEEAGTGALLTAWDAVGELFPAGMLAQAFASYTALLERCAADDACFNRPLEIAAPPALEALVRSVNATAWPHDDARLDDLVRRRVQTCPAAAAVLTSARSMSYAELDARAEAVAAWLIAEGAGPNRLVGVVMEKGWEQVVAVLGVLYAGAAYLPIDAALPAARIALLADAGDTVALLTQPSVRGICPPGRPVLVVDDSVPRVSTRIGRRGDPGDLAYVIFTSGSTGTPKGVMIDHRGAVNTILDLNDRCAIGPDDRVLALSQLNFDLSVYDVFGLLAAGGAIVIPDAERYRDPAHWRDLVRAHAVTLWNTVPALLASFLDLGKVDAPTLASLRQVFLSGDWIPPALPDRVRALAPGARVLAMGGATEASIWSIAYDVERVEPGWTSIPYGKPMRNQTFHVKDDDGRERPIWVPGHLHIGGVGVALGYLGDAAKTAASFIVDPRTGERLYRTGDLGRWLPDGNIEFLGRADTQVKVQGYRIELGEIEAVLETHPAVEHAVVAAFGGRHEAKRLVGFVVPQLEQAGPKDGAPSFDAIVSAAARAAGPGAPYDAATEAASRSLKERAFALFVSNALVDLGCFVTAGETLSLEDVITRGKVLPSYRKWVRRALVRLTELGVLHRAGDRFVRDEALVRRTTAPLRAEAGLAGNDRAFGFLVRSAEQLARILSGEKPAVEVLFGDGAAGGEASAAPSAARRDDALGRCNERIAAAVEAYVQASDGARPVRILELGGGQGTTTRAVLARLGGRSVAYHFTDFSRYFIDEARAELDERHPGMTFGTFDLDRPLDAQGLERHGFDVVVAGDVMHLARDLRSAFRAVRGLLGPSGLFAMSEVAYFDDAYALSFSLQHGDTFEDEDLRPLHPFLPAAGWVGVMEEAGFDASTVLTDPTYPADAEWMYAFVARGPAQVRRSPTPEALREHLRAAVPEYMVPASFVPIDVLPLTANGKVDRSALREPTREAAATSTAVAEPPRDALEEVLAGICSDVLDADIGIRDHFFMVGGDSLLAMRFVAYVRDALEIELPLRAFVLAPTVAEVAEALRKVAGPAEAEALLARAREVLELSRSE